MDRDKLKIVCAAIRLQNGLIITGARHYCPSMHETISALRKGGVEIKPVSGEDQGFIDNHSVYHTRRKAYQIAVKAKQIPKRETDFFDTELFSEDLY